MLVISNGSGVYTSSAFTGTALRNCEKVSVLGKFFGFLVGGRWLVYDPVSDLQVTNLGDVLYAAGSSRVGIFVTANKVYAIGDCSEGTCGQFSLG